MWNYVFYSTALVNVVGAIVFVFFASAEPQPWGHYKDESLIIAKLTAAD